MIPASAPCRSSPPASIARKRCSSAVARPKSEASVSRRTPDGSGPLASAARAKASSTSTTVSVGSVPARGDRARTPTHARPALAQLARQVAHHDRDLLGRRATQAGRRSQSTFARRERVDATEADVATRSASSMGSGRRREWRDPEVGEDASQPRRAHPCGHRRGRASPDSAPSRRGHARARTGRRRKPMPRRRRRRAGRRLPGRRSPRRGAPCRSTTACRVRATWTGRSPRTCGGEFDLAARQAQADDLGQTGAPGTPSGRLAWSRRTRERVPRHARRRPPRARRSPP